MISLVLLVISARALVLQHTRCAPLVVHVLILARLTFPQLELAMVVTFARLVQAASLNLSVRLGSIAHPVLLLRLFARRVRTAAHHGSQLCLGCVRLVTTAHKAVFLALLRFVKLESSVPPVA
jgi:hypothetical protein